MRKKERVFLYEVQKVLEAELLRHNKNLTKKQYYAVDDAVECIKLLLDGEIL